MKNVIKILDRYYQSFINQKRDWDFFLGLADYVKYATETPEVDKILKSIVQKRVNAEKRLKECEEDAIKEAKVIKDKLFQKIKQKKISYEELNKLVQEWNDYANRRIISSLSDAETLSGCLMDIIRSLYDTNHREITKDFIIEEETDPKVIKEFTCFKKLDLYKRERLAYQEKEKIELWRAWDNLALVYIVIFKKEEELEKLRKDEKKWWITFSLQCLIGEMQKIKEGQLFLGSKPLWFTKDDYIGYATRIHNYLIQELSKAEGKKNNKGGIPLSKEKEIKKITLIEMDKDEYLFAINDNYKEIKKVPKYSEWWKIFIKEIKNRNVPYEKRIETKEIPKEMADFFNYNKKCAIYFGGKYKLTNIFIGRGIDIRINPEIKTEVISEKQYQRRKQKMKK